MKVSQIYDYINTIAPFQSACDWDNVGLLIGDENSEITGILVCMDVTSQIVETKCSKSFNLIISHHPIIFKGQKTFTSTSLPYKCVTNGISVISAHTNWDMAKGGINDTLGNALELQNLRPFLRERKRNWKKIIVFVPAEDTENLYQSLCKIGCGTIGNYKDCSSIKEGEGRFTPINDACPYIGVKNKIEKVKEVSLEMIFPPHIEELIIETIQKNHPYETPSFDIYENHGVATEDWIGCVGELKESMSPIDFAEKIKEVTGISPRFNNTNKMIKTVGLCGGSGSDMMIEGMKNHGHKLDAYITAEIPHHMFLQASEMGITMYDGGHHATEMPGMMHLATLLKKAFPKENIEVASVYTGEVTCV